MSHIREDGIKPCTEMVQNSGPLLPDRVQGDPLCGGEAEEDDAGAVGDLGPYTTFMVDLTSHGVLREWWRQPDLNPRFGLERAAVATPPSS